MRGLFARFAVPLGCALVLAASGVSFVLLPLQTAGRSCGGSALTVWVDGEPAAEHDRACRHREGARR